MNIMKQQLIKETLTYDPDTGVVTYTDTPNGVDAVRTPHPDGKLYAAGVNWRTAHVLAVLIMGDGGYRVRPVDGDWTNLKRDNLDITEKPQGSDGVGFNRPRQKWQAWIRVMLRGKKQQVHLGYYDTREEAEVHRAVALATLGLVTEEDKRRAQSAHAAYTKVHGVKMTLTRRELPVTREQVAA